MCLSKVDFSLKFVPDLGEYVGYGWKSGLTVDNTKEWFEARGDQDTVRNARRYGLEEEYDYFGKKYPPGFHIFLNREDAEAYCSGDIYQVAFTDVLAYGKNDTYPNNSKKEALCVIAKHIYFFESDRKRLFFTHSGEAVK